MDTARYRDYLLKAIPTAKPASGGKQITCRCMFCPDGSSRDSRHMYISIPQQPYEPSLYYCHKCHSAGVVTYKQLISWDIYDEDIAIELINHNAECMKHPRLNSKYLNKTHYIMNVRTTTDNEISRFKLKYINDRLGCNFDYEELKRLKIVLNLKDLFNDNHIDTYTRDINVIDQLDINFLGFLSIDNAFLNMRRLCDKGLLIDSIDKRYINYKIHDKFDTSERFYTIPSLINVNSPERVKIHIAEGPFDILSIYKNVMHEYPGIYTSVAGSNYKGLVMYFLEVYKLIHVEFHLYPDNDKFGTINKMRSIADYLRPMNIPLYIHKNTYGNEKDYGIRPENIIDSIIQLN